MPPRTKKNRVVPDVPRSRKPSPKKVQHIIESRGSAIPIKNSDTEISESAFFRPTIRLAETPFASDARGGAPRVSPWNPEEKKFAARVSETPEGMSSMKKFLIVGGSILVLLGGVAAYYAFRVVRPDVGLAFSNPGQVLVGQPFTITVSYSNYSGAVLQNAKLSLIAPAGVSFLGMPEDQRVVAQSIGDIGPGSVSQQTFSLVALGGSQSVKSISAKIAYQTVNSKAEFESSADLDVPVGEAAVGITMTVPEKVVSGEDFDITIAYQNNSPQDLKDLHMRVDYPPVFRFTKSSIPPNRGKNYWDIGALARGEQGKIVVSGNAVGDEGSVFKMTANLLGDMLGQTYALGSQGADLVIATAPLSVSITVNGSADFLAHRGDTLQYVVAYKNNSTVAFQNVTLSAAASGNMFDFTTAQTNGSFNSLANTFSWNAGNTPELANVAPGQSGSVSVSVRLRSDFPIRRISDKNFTLKVQGTIQSLTVPPGTASDKTVSVATLETKVAGEVALRASGFSRDAASGILNSGPYPPKVNTPTEYSIHWSITNYATDVSGVQVRAFIQSGTRFTGTVKSTIDAVPAYNPSSGEITWHIDRIQATKGVVGQPIEAIFQVENTPAVNQVGQSVPLLSQTKIDAHDDFTDQALSMTAPPVTTDIPDDTSFGNIDRRVQQ